MIVKWNFVIYEIKFNSVINDLMNIYKVSGEKGYYSIVLKMFVLFMFIFNFKMFFIIWLEYLY